MKTVIQRVSRAAVRVGGEVVGEIGLGAVLLVGVEKGDGEQDVRTSAKKISELRFFPGETPMGKTLLEVSGRCLVVSQFTLAGSLKKGTRPSFGPAEEPARAEELYGLMVSELRGFGIECATGVFAAHMEVDLVNDGPVTFLLCTRDGKILKVTDVR